MDLQELNTKMLDALFPEIENKNTGEPKSQFTIGDEVGCYRITEKIYVFGHICWIHPENRFFCVQVIKDLGTYKECFFSQDIQPADYVREKIRRHEQKQV